MSHSPSGRRDYQQGSWHTCQPEALRHNGGAGHALLLQ